MSELPHPDLLKATRLTREGRIVEATALLQGVLRGIPSKSEPAETGPVGGRTAEAHLTIDGASRRLGETGASPSLQFPAGPDGGGDQRTISRKIEGPLLSHAPKALRAIVERLGRLGSGLLGSEGLARPQSAPAADMEPAIGRFLAGSYANEAGSRSFKLYVPSHYRGQPLPLIVMLHGCTQSADDFAAGTGMNLVAEEQGCLVVYPEQPSAANASKCWNWFNAGDQRRDRGEPCLIAGITRQVMRDYAVDPHRVYVAGLSAGGAAAAIMGATYPDLYAAIGVHSGLACGAASDLPSAFAAMRQGEAAAGLFSARPARSRDRTAVPTIVFHGDQDATVHPRNGEQVIAQFLASPGEGLASRVQHGEVPGGYGYSRSIHTDTNGRTLVEHWVIRGLGHAWSGGSPRGSYTDPRGPDAAREMVRFFLGHALASSATP